MSALTFYLAASSSRPRDAAAAVRELEALGLQVVLDWTAYLNAEEQDYPALARRDVEAARDADLFVFLAEPKSYGAMVELGARLAAEKRVHAIGGDHFFLRHELVTHHKDWPSFVAYAREAVRA